MDQVTRRRDPGLVKDGGNGLRRVEGLGGFRTQDALGQTRLRVGVNQQDVQAPPGQLPT